MVDDELHLELPVAGGPVHGDKGGEDAEQEEDEDQVLHQPDVLERQHVLHVHTGVSNARSEISLRRIKFNGIMSYPLTLALFQNFYQAWQRGALVSIIGLR